MFPNSDDVVLVSLVEVNLLLVNEIIKSVGVPLVCILFPFALNTNAPVRVEYFQRPLGLLLTGNLRGPL